MSSLVLFALPVVAVWYLSIDQAHAWGSIRPARNENNSHRRRTVDSAPTGRWSSCNRRYRTSHVCANKESNQQLDDFESETDPILRNKIRMDVVRSLQASFYQPTAFYSGEGGTVDAPPQWDNGVLTHLPVWYVGWTELPGRTNVLSINQPVYTNMFESIIRQHESRPMVDQECCYFGHIYRDPNANGKDRDALGTLMRITDYQRMQGGTLLLLVQAMDRIVVTQRLQERPYGIANVQLVPDREELQAMQPQQQKQMPRDDSLGRDETCLNLDSLALASACRASWSDWYPFEFKKTSFPWSNTGGGTYLDFSDIPGSALNAVLPFAEYNLLNQPAFAKPPSVQAFCDEDLQVSSSPNSNYSATYVSKTTAQPVDTVLQKGILKEVSLIDTLCNATLTELEIKLWLLLNDVFVATKISPNPVLLGLIPLDCTWPDDFVLGPNGTSSDQAPTAGNTLSLPVDGYGQLSSIYPACRRQKRFSYSAAHVLERVASATADTELLNSLRQQLLQIPWYVGSRLNLISAAQPNTILVRGLGLVLS